MLMSDLKNFNDPRDRSNNDPIHGASGLQNAAGGNKDVTKQVVGGFGPRSGLAVPKNYVPLPEGRGELRQAYAYMNGAGRPLYLEWCGTVEHTRLQPTDFHGNEQRAQEWRQSEWLRQKGRRRFSNKKILEEYIAKRYATNEGAQAGIQQKQFKHPSSENKFYAFLKGMSASFGSLE